MQVKFWENRTSRNGIFRELIKQPAYEERDSHTGFDAIQHRLSSRFVEEKPDKKNQPCDFQPLAAVLCCATTTV
jgi:hypothetical protein